MSQFELRDYCIGILDELEELKIYSSTIKKVTCRSVKKFRPKWKIKNENRKQ